jgi:hypothetical protein
VTLLGDLIALRATGPASKKPDPIDYSTAVTRALDAAGDNPDIFAAREVLWDRRLKLVENAVRNAQTRGELRGDANPELLMDVLFGAFHTRVVARGRPYSNEFITGLFALIQR